MEINNANFGSVNSGGGSVHIGDRINILNGITILSQEYKEQIQDIQNLLYEFKPVTALTLISKLKKRIGESEIHDKDRVLSKIFFLEAQCKNELKEYTRKDVAQIFLQAHKLNPEDKDLKKRACVEYRFLGDVSKALGLADELLNKDDYDITAWYVKTSLSSDMAAFLKTIPEIVRNNINFQHSTIYDLIGTKNLQFLEDLKDYDLELNIYPENYRELTFDNKGSWMIAIDLLLNKIFNNIPLRYVAGDKIILQKTSDISFVQDLLYRFVSSLEKTEVNDTIIHQKFLFNYISFLVSYDDLYIEKLESYYQDIDNKNWFYLSCLCQVLNNKEEFEKSLNHLNEYETNGGSLDVEFFIFKAAILSFLDKIQDIKDCFISYLKLIKEVDEKQGFNIINTFLSILHFRKISEDDFVTLLQKIFQKVFKNEGIKEVLKIATTVRYTKAYDVEEMYNRLQTLKTEVNFDTNYKDLIAENLNAIGYTSEAIEYMKNYLDKNFISPSLRLYILLLDTLLHSKDDKTLTGHYKELLNLLEFWRITNEYHDLELLKIEHDLYYVINDWEKVNLIDAIFYNKFPHNDNYLYRYLISLEQLKYSEKINEIAEKVKDSYEHEGIGLTVSGILLRNNNLEKGFKILYNLASNKNNSNARLNYFGASLQLKSFLQNYDAVNISCWVTYQVGSKIDKIKVEDNNEGLAKELLGRKVGDEFELAGGFNKKKHNIKILEVTNDGLNLFREISEEAHNPLNNLGIHSFQIDDNTDILEFLKENFGEQGSEEKNNNQSHLNDYYDFKIGFSEITRLVFREKYIDTYFTLTQSQDSKFTTLPISVTPDINLSSHISYALDFSSLMLLYLLEKDYNYIYKHKFHISYYIKWHIENEINDTINSPDSSLSVQITTERIQNFITPEDYKEKRLELLNSLLNWIEKNCFIDLVPEKLDLTLKLDFGETKERFMKQLIDNMFLNNRQDYHLISSDVTLFLLARKNNDLYCNIISPEKYLLHFNPESINNDFYKFLLESNYLGININIDTLKEQFYKLLAGDKSYYYLCLKNLQFYINPNPESIDTICNFLKDLYLEASLSIQNKNNYSEEVLRNFMHGMTRDLKVSLFENLKEKFKFLGDHYNGIIISFYNALKRQNPLL